MGGLGMAEPLHAEPVERVSNFVRTTSWFASHQEELSLLRNIPQELQSTSLLHALQEETIKVYRSAGTSRALAKVLVETIQTNLSFAAVGVGTLVDLQPLYLSDIESSPVLRCARS
jgi:hypothetical protein